MTEGKSRGKLIMPCGTGKSLTSYWIAEELKAQTILVAVPKPCPYPTDGGSMGQRISC